MNDFEDRAQLEELYKYESFLQKRIWNEAIEAVELELHKRLPYPTQACAIIRGLKK